ncbi:phospholipase D family protein [Janthinobacterium lividum]|uniref:phospholipase D family nuclease n=1 Tax=Janthinobacterium lividum TaxID=29581 RepID=UPI000A75C6EA|nr:phospholipase D family protein [Janthinobacterium lividum]
MKNLVLAVALCLANGVPPAALAADAAPVVTIENAFSPDGGAEALVLKVIDSAASNIRLAAYSFSSPHVVEALLQARQRGVDVRVLADTRRNARKNSRAALDRLVGAGIPTRLISRYALHHDKYIVADGVTVQNGSFNYTADAATANSENVIVVWHSARLAQSYLAHWENRWASGIDYARVPRP